MSRKQALTLCAFVDLLLALVISIVAKMTDQIALGYVAVVLMLGAVAMLVMSRRS